MNEHTNIPRDANTATDPEVATVEQEILAEKMTGDIKEEINKEDGGAKVIQMDTSPNSEPVEEFDAKDFDVDKAKALTDVIKLDVVRGNCIGYINLFQELGAIADASVGAKWSLFVNRNGELFIRIQKSIQNWARDHQPKGKEVEAYQVKDLELLTLFANKDPNGNPIMKGQNFDIPEEKIKEFQEVRETLKKDHPVATKMFEDFNQGYDTFVRKNVIIKPYLILRSNIPAGVKPQQLAAIESFIVED